MSTPEQTLKDLIRKCRKNDRDAQFELYSRYADAMLNCAFRITGNREDAEDVLQEAYISAFNNLGKYRGDATFGSWLKKIVINKSLNLMKKKKVELTFPEEAEYEAFEVIDTFDDAEFNVKKELVLEALQKLPPGFRTVLSLYLLEGYDHQEISEILNISKATSLTQYHRGKKKLRNLVMNLQLKIQENGQSGKVVQRS